MKFINKPFSYYLPLIVAISFIIILIFLPTGFEDALTEAGVQRVKATVLDTNENYIVDNAIMRTGEQLCTVMVDNGRFKGQTLDAVNLLSGSLESDKIFEVGDKALIVINYSDDNIGSVTMIDHYRINKEIILSIIFMAFLIFFAGETGLRAIVSFIFTILSIWKLLIPMYLKGYNPILIGLLIVTLLTIIIISLVYGFNKLSLSAISGSMLGIIVTCIVAIITTSQFKLHGSIMSGSESLLYSGFEYLDLTKIFIASIFIGSSGAMMDLAVDITSSINEIVENTPDITFKDATKSGITIGKAAMGTMTTTLLIAYSGGYVALLMVFMAQGTPLINILNYKYISAEIAHTVVGSFGLILVAPFTAVTSGLLLTKK